MAYSHFIVTVDADVVLMEDSREHSAPSTTS